MSLPRIAVDAMGGDEGVRVMVEGAALARRRHDRFKFLLVGDEARIKAALDNHPNLRGASEILHCDDVVAGDEKPSQALRRAKTTSMGLAINAVKTGEAGAAVSGGNTGALMAMAKLALRTMPGIDRPALSALLPTLGENDLVMLDLGANTDCDARNLVQFAIMGAAYSRIVTGREEPRVRLLNIGTEEIKGNQQVKLAASLLQQARGLNYIGFVEGDGLYRGETDVAVCDGFVGNILLKSSEGLVSMISRRIEALFSESMGSRLLGSLALPLLQRLHGDLAPAQHNGASFLGLQGIVVKSHGAAGSEAFQSAIRRALLEIRENLPQRLHGRLEHLLL